MADEIILNELHNHFLDSSIAELTEIFLQAKQLERHRNSNYLQKKDELKLDLLAVLQQEMSRGLDCWHISPSREGHLVVSSDKLFLLTIYGCHVIYANWLFFEGELAVKDTRWYEDDKLIVFDLHNIVRQEFQHVICYCDADDEFMVWKGKAKKAERQDLDTEGIGTMFEKWDLDW